MSLLFLSLDANAPARKARRAELDALISAELDRVWAEFGPLMPTHEHFLANVAPLFPLTPEMQYYFGGNANGVYPYTEYTLQLRKEQCAIPWSEVEQQVCPQCGKSHDRIWLIRRAYVGPFGHFPTYRLNGQIQVIDPSLPHTVSKIPANAVPLTPEESAAVWHATSPDHSFASGAYATVMQIAARIAPDRRRAA